MLLGFPIEVGTDDHRVVDYVSHGEDDEENPKNTHFLCPDNVRSNSLLKSCGVTGKCQRRGIFGLPPKGKLEMK